MKCIVVDDEAVSRKIVVGYVNRTSGLELEAEYGDALKAFEHLQSGGIDLVFLDIEMPEMTGMQIIQSLDSMPQIVMITGRAEYAVKAFEFSVTDYLVKPVAYERFLSAVEKARMNLNRPVLETQGEKDIYVKSDGKIIRIKLEQINFVEALSDYVIINTNDKKHVVHSTMKNIEQRLPSPLFSRVHRSFIINVKKIEMIEDMNVLMPGNKTIPIGASYKASFLERLNFL